jgi:hypothetical protein
MSDEDNGLVKALRWVMDIDPATVIADAEKKPVLPSHAPDDSFARSRRRAGARADPPLPSATTS